MRKSILCTLVLGGAACAGGPEPKQQQTSEIYGEASEVREGTVASISEERLTIVDPSRPNAAAVVLDIGSQTTFVEGGDFVDRGEIDEGENVRVFYEEAEGAERALRIEVLAGEESEEVEERFE